MNDTIHGRMILGDKEWRRSGRLNPEAKIPLSQIIAVSGWYIEDGEWFWPQFSARGHMWMISTFDDYAAVCAHLGLDAPKRFCEFNYQEHLDCWQEFGGIGTVTKKILPVPEINIKEQTQTWRKRIFGS